MPRVSELRPQARARYHGAVAGDYLLRTGLASALTGAMVPGSIFLDGSAERARLEFYAELASRAEASEVFVPPPRAVKLSTAPGDGPGGGRRTGRAAALP